METCFKIDSWVHVRSLAKNISESFSSWSALTMGVPQGFLLGPILFNTYSNDKFHLLDCNICNFADDIEPYTTKKINTNKIHQFHERALRLLYEDHI